MQFVKNILIAILVCFALLVDRSCQATLIIGVPNQEGIFIISDKLGHNTLSGFSDGLEKVVRLSPDAAVAVTGTAVFAWEKQSGTNILIKDRLSTWDLAKNYFSTNTISGFNGQDFASCMSEQLSNYFAEAKFTFTPSEEPGCQFIIFRITPSKECRTFMALLRFTETETGITISTSCQEAVQNEDSADQILAFGSAELPIELLHGHDPQFDDVRNDSIISKFLPDPPQINEVKLLDAETFARKLMALASQKTQLINPSSIIGTNLDEMILRFSDAATGHHP